MTKAENTEDILENVVGSSGGGHQKNSIETNEVDWTHSLLYCPVSQGPLYPLSHDPQHAHSQRSLPWYT